MLKNLLQMHLKSDSKTEEATCDLIRNKIGDKITRVPKTLPKNNSERNEGEILRERYIYFQN